MFPQLIHYGHFFLPTYGFLVSMGVLLGLWISVRNAERLGYDERSESADVYVTVRAAPALQDCTANLKAPILIRSGTAHQVINQAASATLRARLFPAEPPASEQQAC